MDLEKDHNIKICRFNKNYPGVPPQTCSAAGMYPSVWFAIASGSKQSYEILTQRERKIWKYGKRLLDDNELPPIDLEDFAWAAIVHNNCSTVAKWLANALTPGKCNGAGINTGEISAFLVYFVLKTLEEDGLITRISKQQQVYCLFSDFILHLPGYRAVIKKRNIKSESYPGALIREYLIEILNDGVALY